MTCTSIEVNINNSLLTHAVTFFCSVSTTSQMSAVSPDTRIDRAIVNHAQPSIPDATYNLMGSRVGPSYKGLVIRSGRQVVVR